MCRIIYNIEDKYGTVVLCNFVYKRDLPQNQNCQSPKGKKSANFTIKCFPSLNVNIKQYCSYIIFNKLKNAFK